MNVRINQRYVIMDSCYVGDSKFVLVVHSTAPQ